MEQYLLSQFGSSAERINSAIVSLKKGGGILLVDDDDRENEGDIIFPAETLTEEQMALLISRLFRVLQKVICRQYQII